MGNVVTQPGDRCLPLSIQPRQALSFFHHLGGGLLQQEEHLDRPLQLGRHGEGVQHAVLQAGLHCGAAVCIQLPGQEALADSSKGNYPVLVFKDFLYSDGYPK